MNGTIKFFDEVKRWGFINGEDGEAYFFHQNWLSEPAPRPLSPDHRVSFRPEDAPRGKQAREVRLLELPRPPFPKKLTSNPFTPQDPIRDPRKFAGRAEALANAIDCLFNNKNILVTGARGIGKSSIAYQLIELTRGDRTLIDRIGIDSGSYEFNHLTGDHRCLENNSLAALARGLLSTLHFRNGHEILGATSTTRREWDFKFFRSSEEVERTPLPFDEVALEFSIATERILTDIDRPTTGVCYLIDEVDVLSPDVLVAPFLKAVTEKLHFDGFENVSFVISGVTGSITDLISQHPSASRLIEILHLQPMAADELGQIIDNCLDGTQVSMTPNARAMVIRLAAHFPAPVHLLGYHAFRLNHDGEIDGADLAAARDFVVQELKRGEFQGRLDRLAGTVPLKALRILALEGNRDATTDWLANKLSTTPRTVAGMMSDPEQLGRIVRLHDNRWEIAEPLFAIYLRWLFRPSVGRQKAANTVAAPDGWHRR